LGRNNRGIKHNSLSTKSYDATEYYEKILNPTLPTPYSDMGFVFNKIVISTETTATCTIAELKIFGKDDIFTTTWTTNNNGDRY
jgi:hypothetical protein